MFQRIFRLCVLVFIIPVFFIRSSSDCGGVSEEEKKRKEKEQTILSVAYLYENDQFSIGGVASGMNADGYKANLRLFGAVNNTLSEITVSQDGEFTFPIKLKGASVYNLMFWSYGPANYQSGKSYECKIENPNEAHVITSNITNLKLICTTSSLSSGKSSYRMFVTSSSFANGNLGGISGADAYCTADSKKPSDGSTYKAFITDGTNRRACSTINCSGGSSEGIDWVLKPNQTYTRLDGTVIGVTNSAGIFTSTFTNPIDASSSYITFRTGFKFSGGADWTTGTTTHCSNWSVSGTPPPNGIEGGTGTSNTSPSNMVYMNASSCTITSKLLCIEQ